jgi:hypothetical protein
MMVKTGNVNILVNVIEEQGIGIAARIKEKKYGISKNEGIAESGIRKKLGGWSLQRGKP